MDKATQNKRKKDTSYHPETHVRDVNSRDIFKNNILASQFLKNYTNIPIFTNITRKMWRMSRVNTVHFWELSMNQMQ